MKRMKRTLPASLRAGARCCRRDVLGMVSAGIFLTLKKAEAHQKLWKPRLYWGTVNFNEQLTRQDEWKQAAARTDGMLLHLHYFVRHMNTPENKMQENVPETIRRIAPHLRSTASIIELTYHIQNAASSPEGIAQSHAHNIKEIEALGIPIAGVNVDWILSGLPVQISETPQNSNETNTSYGSRLLDGMLKKSARYVKAFRDTGRDEKLIAVFPPLYMDEGRWINARKEARHGITVSRLLNGLFDVGFDGFTADSPYFVMANAAYQKAGYFDALRSIEQTCRKRNKKFGFILNGNNGETEPNVYDAEFAKLTLRALDLMLAARLRPDFLFLESWYKGPFRLVPETTPGTLTHTVLQIADKLDALQK